MGVNGISENGIRQFLITGRIGNHDRGRLAAECNRLVRSETQRSADRAVKLAEQFILRSHLLSDEAIAIALRASGWANLVAGNYRHARDNYLEARKILKANPLERAKIDRILIDVFMYLGRRAESKRRARLATQTFRRLEATDELAKTDVNYANVLHRRDRHKEARKLYTRAAEHFASRGNEPALALCWYNLANTEAQLFDFEAAEKHFSEARTIFQKHDRDLHATGCLYGLAWLNLLRGEFHRALHQLADCESSYIESGQKRELLLCQLDRAEVYLGLNLFTDARREAERALQLANQLAISYEKAKAEFFIGKALIGLGRLSEARKRFDRAAEGFGREANQGFQAASELARLQLDKNKKARLQRLKSARRKFTNAQLPLWEAICDLQILSQQPKDQTALVRLTKNRTVKAMPQLSAHYHTIRGDREARRNHMKSAIKHWTEAADILDAVRAKLPPLELRSAFFQNRSEPHRHLVETESGDNPLLGAAWSERLKTAGLWSTSEDLFSANPTRARIQQTLSELANELFAVSLLAGNRSQKRSAVASRTELGQQLQRNLRHYLSSPHLTPDGHEQASEVQNLFVSLPRHIPVVQFYIGGSDIIAFIHFAGECRSVRFLQGTPLLQKLVARWRFLIESDHGNGTNSSRVDLQSEQELLHRISDWLLPPLELPSHCNRLVLVPEGRLLSIPWLALPIDGETLSDRFALSITPSIRHYIHAGRKPIAARKRTIVVGSSAGLPYVQNEIEVVRDRFGSANSRVVNPCRRGDLLSLQDADIWHYSGHAEFRADNPFYSSLLLADGPLFAADLRLKNTGVNLVTLAACRTGQQNYRSGEESSGIVRSLLEMGARSVVAGNWAVSDRATSKWMDLFYEKYTQCRSAAAAVQHASLHIREEFPSTYYWGAFFAYGN